MNHGGRWIPGPPTSWRSTVSRTRLTAGSTHAGKCRVGFRNGPYSQAVQPSASHFPGAAQPGCRKAQEGAQQVSGEQGCVRPAVTVNGVKPQG